jgi:S1-C subfamily serine protease
VVSKISALGRSQFRIEPVQDFIQTDAAINPGNSSGALVDVKGQVLLRIVHQGETLFVVISPEPDGDE